MQNGAGGTTVFTIGHSLHSWEAFLSLVRSREIEVLVDVRSSPHSARAPHFNAEVLKAACREAGLRYLQMGDQLGGRTDQSSLLTQGGRVDYDRLAETESFRSGLVRLANGARTHRMALMCAEKDPITCHRALLVSRHLLPLLGPAGGISHILADGRGLSQADLETELLHVAGLPAGPDLFESDEIRRATAYRHQAERVAFLVRDRANPILSDEVD